jgi:hypothetical protein
MPTNEAKRRAEEVILKWLSGTGTPADFLRPAQRAWLICEIAEALAMPDATEHFLIWSFEHDGWWKRGSGYTRGRLDFEAAGRFTEAEAKEICGKANYVGLEEALVPLGPHTLAGERERLRRG